MADVPLRPATLAPSVMFETREMVELNQKLKDLGIEQTIQLPQICVVGDQSTGKSSLIEALSKIKVPRAAGCCTQCPLEINLLRTQNNSEPWSCKVSLQLKYAYLPSAAGKKPNKNRPMGPWEKLQEIKLQPFAETTVKEEVYDLIERAQSAILNPTSDVRAQLHHAGSAKSAPTYEIKFSPNAVRLDIMQNESPNLSFIDLPGVITNVDKREDAWLVQLVKALAMSYIELPRSILLTLLPMTNDIANSTALSILQDLAAGNRALGVMTKPDRIQNEDALLQFREVLTGVKGPVLKHGYHVVMMDPNLMLSHADSMQKEKDFFARQSRGLQETCRNLPVTQSRIADHLSAVEEELESIPAPPDLQVLPNVLYALVKDFEHRMRTMFEGGGNPDDFSFRKDWDNLAEGFRKTLKDAFPRVQILTEVEVRQSKEANAITRGNPALTHANGQEIMVSSDEDAPNRRIAPATPIQKPAYHISFPLAEIRSINQRHAAGGLPRSNIFPMALDDMNKRSVSKWHKPLKKFMDNTESLIQQCVDSHISLVFGAYKDMPLYQVLKVNIKDWLEGACTKQRSKSEAICDTEQMKPFTLDAATHARERNKILETLRERRLKSRLELEQKAVARTDVRGRAKAVAVREEDLPPDEWDTELSMLANVRSYYFIAASRFADVVCQGIYARLFYWCGHDLSTAIMEYLGPMQADKHQQIQELMSEDPTRLRRRNKLIRERDSLLEARKLVEDTLAASRITAQHSSANGKRSISDVEDADIERADDGQAGSPTKKNCLGATVEDEIHDE